MTPIRIPRLSLVLLVGVAGSGKSTFARKHFSATEVISSDHCRGMICDDENNQAVTKEAFDLLHYIAAKRLKRGRLTVIDATNVQAMSRQPLLRLARKYHVPVIAIVLNLPEYVCRERDRKRSDRTVGTEVIRSQARELRFSAGNLKKEGFRNIYVLKSPEEAEAAEIVRQPLWCNKRHEHGPFDIIGDIHGCFDELAALLQKLGYQITRTSPEENYGYRVTHPQPRKVIFLGDLADRGPKAPEVLRLVMGMVSDRTGFCLLGNHDLKLWKYLCGRKIRIQHGLDRTIAQLDREPRSFHYDVREFLYRLTHHYVLDSGRLVVAHAGVKQEMQGRDSKAVRAFCLYGDTTGKSDDTGLPIRRDWAGEYRGKATVIYGHTPVAETEWVKNTVNIDTGCVFGGRLTALRYPEGELISVPARKVWCDASDR